MRATWFIPEIWICLTHKVKKKKTLWGALLWIENFHTALFILKMCRFTKSFAPTLYPITHTFNSAIHWHYTDSVGCIEFTTSHTWSNQYPFVNLPPYLRCLMSVSSWEHLVQLYRSSQNKREAHQDRSSISALVLNPTLRGLGNTASRITVCKQHIKA